MTAVWQEGGHASINGHGDFCLSVATDSHGPKQRLLPAPTCVTGRVGHTADEPRAVRHDLAGATILASTRPPDTAQDTTQGAV